MSNTKLPALSDERIYELADSEDATINDRGWGPKFSTLRFARLVEEAAILADRERQAGKAVASATISGALFDFLGFLTTSEARWTFSSRDDASPAVHALEQWAETRGLSLDEANVSGWRESLASLPAPQAVQAGWKLVPVEPTPSMLVAMWEHRSSMTGFGENKIARVGYSAMLAAAPSPDGKAEQEEAPSDLSVLRRIHKLLVNQVRPALRSPVITKDVDDAAEALSALMSRTQTEAPSDSTLKLAEMILADCGHSTAISTRLRDRVAERIERHLAAQPTEASCRSTNADGHVLLPFEPTDEMEVAAEDAYEESGSPFPNWKAVYRAMRDAAPSPDGKAEPAQVNISPAERAANAETLERWARASKAEQAEAPSDEVVAVEFYRLNPSAALFDFRNRVATQPTASNAEARGIVAMEHIGTLNPDYPHRLKCKQCGSEAGQVLRAGSDIFDCLCCGFFTYVEGVNLNARAALASKPPQGEQKPDGRLHVDGYFTWSEGKRPAYIADRGLPCDFYLAPAQPEQVAQDSLNLESTIREAFHAIEADDYPRCRAMLLGTLMGLSDRSRRAARARGEGERS